MTNSDNVMTLLAEANPIPDVAALERQPQFVRPDHIDVVSVRETFVPPARVRWAMVSAVALAAVFAIAFFVLTRSSTVEPVETIPGPTLPTTPAPTTAPVTTSSPPAPPSVEGAWDAVSYSLVFADGRYAVETADLAVDAGTYLLEGDELVLVSDASSASCPAGAEASFTVDLSADALELEPIDDACGLDRGIGVGSKSLQPGDGTGLPPSALDVARPLSQLSGPGLYVADRFSPEFSVVLPRGWSFHASVLPADIDFASSVNDMNTLIVWRRQNVDTPSGVHELFAADPVVQVEDPQPVAIAGVEGITFDYLSPGPNSLLNAPGGGQIVGPPENVWRTWAVDVEGTVVTIVASFDPETLPEKSAEVERILDSIIWSD
jgi:hypothetical protein